MEKNILTPDEVLKILKDGNRRFYQSVSTTKYHYLSILNTLNGQEPIAVVLSCADSRVPVEYVFDQGIGDLFVTRVAGNFATKAIVGSMEYACKFLGAKLIVIMGHQHCGAIKAAIDGINIGNISTINNAIAPAVSKSTTFESEHLSTNKEYVEHVTIKNIENTIEYIKQNSQILRDMQEDGKINIVGAMYYIETGIVDFLV